MYPDVSQSKEMGVEVRYTGAFEKFKWWISLQSWNNFIITHPGYFNW